jgi:hypothetical protein
MNFVNGVYDQLPGREAVATAAQYVAVAAISAIAGGLVYRYGPVIMQIGLRALFNPQTRVGQAALEMGNYMAIERVTPLLATAVHTAIQHITIFAPRAPAAIPVVPFIDEPADLDDAAPAAQAMAAPVADVDG